MKILYLMQVDWNWIKQRPQFLAKLLSKQHEVMVVYPRQRNRKGLCRNESEGIKMIPVYQIPLQGSISFLRKIAESLTKVIIRHRIKCFCPDVVWLCSPSFIKYLEKGKYRIVYDCMDDYYSMSRNRDILTWEDETCKCANAIFASSQSLIKKLQDRYGVPEKLIYLIRNGFEAEPFDYSDQKKDDAFHIGYVGTISEWFDFEAIEYVISNTNGVIFDLFGPCKESIRAAHVSDRIVFHGVIEHSQIYYNISGLDCLIMPFVLNDIIESVDPVKLYEYISYNKNIISVQYEEVQRFENFVHFYSSKDELLNCVKSVMANNRLKYSLEDKEQFLKMNTWENRVYRINEILDSLDGQGDSI